MFDNKPQQTNKFSVSDTNTDKPFPFKKVDSPNTTQQKHEAPQQLKKELNMTKAPVEDILAETEKAPQQNLQDQPQQPADQNKIDLKNPTQVPSMQAHAVPKSLPIQNQNNEATSENQSTAQRVMKKSNKAVTIIFIVIIVIVLIITASFAFSYFTQAQKKSQINQQSDQPSQNLQNLFDVLKDTTDTTDTSSQETNDTNDFIQDVNQNINNEVDLQINSGTQLDLQDTDLDGLDDEREIQLGTNPQSADTDNDGLMDFEEVEIYKSDPIVPDTDGDGYLDGDEVKNGYHPLIPGSARL